MPHSSPNPDQRIDAAVESVRASTSPLDPEQIVLGVHRRTNRSRGVRMKIALATICSATAAGFAGLALWPHPAMATMDQILLATKAKPTFKLILTSDHKFPTGYIGQFTFTNWQLHDRVVTLSLHRKLDPKTDPGKTIEQMPMERSMTWTMADGTTIYSEPGLPKAIRGHGDPRPFEDLPTLDRQFNGAKTLSTQPSVHAHGGVFDRYVMKLGLADDVNVHQTVYVDTSSHLIRFIESPRYGGSGKEPMWLRGMDSTWEFSYPDESTLAREAPPAPADDQITDTVDEKNRFMEDLKSPVATQVVGGVSESLYALVIRPSGIVVAVTRGGDPRDVTDPHHLVVEGYDGFNADQKGFTVGRFLALVQPNPNRNPMWFAGFKRIGGKDYTAEGFGVRLNGKMPSSLTVKVPVWRYDTAHPIKTGKDAEVRTVYHSTFLGYATFTTDRVFYMGGQAAGNWGGQELPSDYQIGSQKGKVPTLYGW